MRTDCDATAAATTTTTATVMHAITPNDSFSHQSVVTSDDSASNDNAVCVDPATVDLVLEMTATYDADGFQLPTAVSRSDVVAALLHASGDIARAVDDVMSLLAIKQLRVDEAHARTERLDSDTRLQWHELCTGLGIHECDAFMQALDSLPDDEKDALLSTNGGFLQQLLLDLDDQHSAAESTENDHPIAKLQRMYPHYRMEVIERVFETHGFDVNAAADALYNLRGVDAVQSFAAVVSAQTRAASDRHELQTIGPKVASRGHFPALPAAPPQPNGRSQQRRQLSTNRSTRRGPSLTNSVLQVNAWERQDNAVSNGSVLESTLSSELKVDRLKLRLPSIDRGVIQTTFFLNGCNSDVTEAALREIFDLPVALCDMSDISGDDVGADDAASPVDGAPSRFDYEETPSYANSRARVDAAREALSSRYCAVLDSFRRSNTILATDRVRELSRARREVRESQREAAHQFFLAHVPMLRQGRPIDLHGLLVMEALQVANEAIEFCREQRIRQCLLISGVGHHSVGGRARILTALQLSLTRRQIAFRSNGGVLTVFPSRSTQQ